MGSLLAHGALLTASAWGYTAPTPVRDGSRSHYGDGMFVLHADFPVYWPPPPALQACFARPAFQWGGYGTSPLESYGGEAQETTSTWTPAEAASYGTSEAESRRSVLEMTLYDCLGAAGVTGSGRAGRVFVRVARHDDGSAHAQAFALDETMNDPRLLCCFRKAQEAVLPALRPGTALRYVVTSAEDGTTLVPPTP
jgi:hypothetical protein